MSQRVPFAKPLDELQCERLSKQIIKELNLTKSQALGEYLEKIFYGSKSYNYEIWAEYDSEHEKVKSFVRLGYLFFLDAERYLKLSEGLKEELRGNSILIHDLNDSCISDIHYRYYTMTSIVAMLNSELSERHIIDAGAGEAILTFHKRGVRRY